MDRPYLEMPIQDLEKIVRENKSSRVVLAKVKEELEFRTNRRAQQLQKEVLALLGGDLPMPPRKPPKEPPDSQLPLIR